MHRINIRIRTKLLSLLLKFHVIHFWSASFTWTTFMKQKRGYQQYFFWHNITTITSLDLDGLQIYTDDSYDGCRRKIFHFRNIRFVEKYRNSDRSDTIALFNITLWREVKLKTRSNIKNTSFVLRNVSYAVLYSDLEYQYE